MKLGWLRIMQPMQGQSKGYVVLAWHRKAWWSWGVWWRPCESTWIQRWKIYGWRRCLNIAIGRFGELSFQHQM